MVIGAKRLAGSHLTEGGLALYDMSNCFYEGHQCHLARVGKDKGGPPGTAVIGYGVLEDQEGRPVAMEVYPGDRGDPSTVADQVVKVRA